MQQFVIRYTDPTTKAQYYVDSHDNKDNTPCIGDGTSPPLFYSTKAEAIASAAVLRKELEAIGYKGKIDIVEQQ